MKRKNPLLHLQFNPFHDTVIRTHTHMLHCLVPSSPNMIRELKMLAKTTFLRREFILHLLTENLYKELVLKWRPSQDYKLQRHFKLNGQSKNKWSEDSGWRSHKGHTFVETIPICKSLSLVLSFLDRANQTIKHSLGIENLFQANLSHLTVGPYLVSSCIHLQYHNSS